MRRDNILLEAGIVIVIVGLIGTAWWYAEKASNAASRRLATAHPPVIFVCTPKRVGPSSTEVALDEIRMKLLSIDERLERLEHPVRFTPNSGTMPLVLPDYQPATTTRK